MKKIVIIAALLVLALFTGACGPAEEEEAATPEETTAPPPAPEKGADVGAGGKVTGVDRLVCIENTAGYDARHEEVRPYFDDMRDRGVELAKQGKTAELGGIVDETIEEMEDDGFYCDLRKHQAFAKEQKAKGKALAEEHLKMMQEQQAKTGKNEAGQDISKIPKEKPSPERAACLREYLSSFGKDAGKEQQRVVAEANERGVSPLDVVGC